MAVLAAYVEGWSYKELAHHHGVPLNTMRTWLRRSLLALQACLDDERQGSGHRRWLSRGRCRASLRKLRLRQPQHGRAALVEAKRGARRRDPM
jgi:hypothetical protein